MDITRIARTQPIDPPGFDHETTSHSSDKSGRARCLVTIVNKSNLNLKSELPIFRHYK